MTMMVLVNAVDYDGGTVGRASGAQVVDGLATAVHVTFGVDHRMLPQIVEQLMDEGEVLCEVEGWQVLNSVRMPDGER